MECIYCKNECKKKGMRNGRQRYQYKVCRRNMQQHYVKSRIPQEKYRWVVKLNNEGCGISSIARLLSVSKSSVQRLVERVAASLQMPKLNERGQSYEVDELRTYCQNKQNEVWLIYAITRRTKQVVDFFAGRRTKENIAKVVTTLEKLQPKHIYSDRLNIYGTLIASSIHKIYPRCTNRIERCNLTLRTHIKRLARKTICFTRNQNMLRCCVQLYFCC